MGSLPPNAKLVYESPDGGNTIYAREIGAPPSTRKMVGQSYEAKNKFEQIQEDKLWGEIRRAARTNPTLQKALEQCIIIHHLSKDKEEVQWHPV